MSCPGVEPVDAADRYVRGQLSEQERDAFELHFFDCSRCLDEVRMLLAVRRELSRSGGRGLSWARRVLPLAAAAALVLVSVLGTLWWTHRPAELSALARIDPPPYEEIRLRGTAGPSAEAFRDAMRYYVAGDYDRAIPGLEAALKTSGGADHVRFFLGVSHLLAGDGERAIAELRQVSESESPFAEESGYYLAKALIGEGELRQARETLRDVVAAGGAKAREAERLLERLEDLRKKSR